jgi:uncharacterized membrane protein
MKLLLLIVSIVLFALFAIFALSDGTWSTTTHLFALLGFGLAAFAASFLPIP